MLFYRMEFFFFFALVLTTAALARTPRARKCVLLFASYYFYAYWDWRLLPLLMLSTIINYLAGLGIGQAARAREHRKSLLVAAITFNLGILGFFKYFGFFCQSLQTILGPLGLHWGTINIVLPIGISFYTFQATSYVVDVYRGDIPPCRDLLDFALFKAFFPQLVAGPIVRAVDFLPQLQSDIRMSWPDTFVGFRQFTIGLFKKVFIADRLAVFVDPVFANAGVFDAGSTWLAVLAYGLQIYCDFCGYSDMAIGTARILGYRLPVNFRSPYLATSVSDFWHRWHITLSTWLRDYLYIPLGGSRAGERRTYLNLLLTMVLGGLWHGASWTFVCWGGFLGLALVGDKWVRTRVKLDHWPLTVRTILGWCITMLIVFTAWVFFRAPSLGDAFLILRQMYVHPSGISWYHPFAVSALVTVVVVHMLTAKGHLQLGQLLPDRIITPVVLFSIWWLVLAFPPQGFNPFVYFQF